MKKLLLFLGIVLLLLSWNTGFAADKSARDLTASLGLLDGRVNSDGTGIFVDIIKAIDEIYPGKINIEIFPMVRSVENVVQGKADFHMLSLRNPSVPLSELPYQYVSESIFSIPLILYSHKDKIITRKMILNALDKGGQFPYTIEVVRGHEKTSRFPVTMAAQGNDPSPSLLKVQNKRVDACLFSQDIGDPAVRKLKLNNIHRELHEEFDVVFVIPKGPKGDELDPILSNCLRKIKASGKLQKIIKGYYEPYNVWQPHEMGWE